MYNGDCKSQNVGFEGFIKRMKTYIELKVPINFGEIWFKKLRDNFSTLPIKWQQGYYHITIAFVDDTPIDVDITPILEKLLNFQRPVVFTFDNIDVFDTKSGMFIVHLGVKDVPSSFTSLVNTIRCELKNVGCIIRSDFKLHVTLGRLIAPQIQLVKVQEMAHSFFLPSFTLTLSDIDYRVFRGSVLYETKLLPL